MTHVNNTKKQRFCWLSQKEREYIESTPLEHIKGYGQYFTSPSVAKFMCAWACSNAQTMLDPAAGNSIFLSYAKETNPECHLFGYEIDQKILDYFGNPANAFLKNENYLLDGWDARYDSIVCNPPYNRFQAISNRSEILDSIYQHTGIEYSSYTNLYVLFLIKSIFQMTNTGKLAYLVPSEFLNSKYGIPIKRLMLDKRLIRAIINFKNNSEMFFNATTTYCILLLDYENKDSIGFYNLNSIEDLHYLSFGKINRYKHIEVKFENIRAEEKWRCYLNQETSKKYHHLVDVLNYCTVTRGIATGANDFFCLSMDDIKKYDIDKQYVTRCVCRSADVKTVIFKDSDFQLLLSKGKTVYLLDVKKEPTGGLIRYIKQGEEKRVNKKYLPARRNPWYSMEQKPTAPIWVCSACREKIKFIRNLAGTKSLTTFHSVYIKGLFEQYSDIIFCYFLTPIAQEILRENRKELGNGLEKFQPNDLNFAKMIDIQIISNADQEKILELYGKLYDGDSKEIISELNGIFIKYLKDDVK